MMRQPACVACRWGTGTACEKPTNTAARKEMEDKLKEMQMARAKQDETWLAPPAAPAKEEDLKK